MKFSAFLLLLSGCFLLQTCCYYPFGDPDLCEYYAIEKTVRAPLKFEYTVNTSGKFSEAHVVTASDILRALNEENTDGEIKKIEINGAEIKYQRFEDNQAGLLSVMILIVDNTTNIPLMYEVKDLPLLDIPAIPFITDGININSYLNNQGINELKKILRNNLDFVNDDGFSAILFGNGLPQGALTHFSLTFDMDLTVAYEVCELLPLGMGEKVCD